MWYFGKEITRTGMAPQPVSVPTTGIDSARFMIMPPANQGLGITYHPTIPGFVNRQLIVMFRPDAPLQERMRVLSKYNCQEIRTSQYAGFTLIALPTFLSVFDAQEDFLVEPSVLYAEPNYLRHAHLVPNDPYYPYQWHLPHMFTDFAWNLATGTGAVVALLDSGVAYRTATPYALAPDLANTIIRPGLDFVNGDAFPDDDRGHGTHICGCIAQSTNNFIGVAGTAFSSTVLAIKVMDNVGNVTIADEVEGIYYAINNGAKIINMSLGGVGTSITEQTATTAAYNAGLVIFASSGNAGSTTLEYPASYPECVSVGAVQYDRTRPAYSNYGTALELVAPGGNINLDQNLDGYADGILHQTHNGTDFTVFYYYFMEGTSPACALASGVAALVVSKSTTALTPAAIRTTLRNTAIDLGIAGWDQEYGYGEVNAYQAVLNTT